MPQGPQQIYSASLGKVITVQPGESYDQAYERAAKGGPDPGAAPVVSGPPPSPGTVLTANPGGGRGTGYDPTKYNAKTAAKGLLTGLAEGSGILRPIQTASRMPSQGSTEDIARWGAEMGGDTLSFVGGLVGGLPRRMVTTAAGGALKGLGKEGGSPLDEASFQAAMEGLSSIAGYRVPRMGSRAGLRLGGVRGDISEVIDALARERALPGGKLLGEKPFRRGIALGDEAKVQSRIGEVAQARDAVAKTKTGEYPVSALKGSTAPSSRKAEFGARGMDVADALKAQEKDAIAQMGTLARISGRGKTFTDLSPGGQVSARKLRSATKKSSVRYRESAPINAERGLKMQEQFGFEARPIFKARKLHEQVADNAPGLGAEAFYGKNKEELLKIFPELGEFNKRLTDLYSINEATRHIRGKGSIFGTPGEIGARGGLGAGVAQNVAFLTGGGGSPLLRALGGPAAILGASAKGASTAGNALGAFAEMAPSGFRFTDVVSDASEFKDLFDEKKTPKKRKPGGR